MEILIFVNLNWQITLFSGVQNVGTYQTTYLFPYLITYLLSYLLGCLLTYLLT